MNIELSYKLINKFFKVCDIPHIDILESNIFDLNDRIDLYNQQFDSIRKFDIFKKDLLDICCSPSTNNDNDHHKYFKYYDDLTYKIINHIKDKPKYNELINLDINHSIFKKNKNKVKGMNLYTQLNNGKSFISIDIKHSNYNSLKYYDNSIVDGTSSYVDFISQFTQYEHLIKSKHFRQYIFGHLNPKRQVMISEHIIDTIINILKNHDENYYVNTNIVSLSSDEIIIDNVDYFDEHISPIINTICVETHINKFKLISNPNFYVLKNLETGKITFKGLNREYYPFVIRLLQNKKFKDSDYIFFHNDKICKYLESPITELCLE